jgi:hypothetical protein
VAQTLELNPDGHARLAGPDPLIGQRLLHYRVVEVIGQGGMSVVYRGHDERLHRDVAIKVLHPFLAEKTECRARLVREARAVARLEHPHILKVFDFSGEPDPITLDDVDAPSGRDRVRGYAEGFIVAELVRGATLKHLAEKHQLWRCPEVGAMVVWQLALALAHAHENGVVHRDLKPENVMVRDDGWLKLMDFGIAHIADQKGLTVTGTLLGSPAHMAPEVIDGHPADARSDLFALGTILYWITTGALPFEAQTPHALLKQIVEGKSPPAQQRSPRVSDDLARVLAKAMATRPDDRYQSATALADALAELLEKSGLAAAPDALRRILANPAAELPQASAAVRGAFLARAEQWVRDGAPGRALSALNRVLADDGDDKDARALLERVQGELDDDEPGDAAPVVTLHTPPPAELTEPSRTVDVAPPAVLLKRLGLVAAASAMIAAAIFIAIRVDAAQDPLPPAAPPPVAHDAPPAKPQKIIFAREKEKEKDKEKERDRPTKPREDREKDAARPAGEAALPTRNVTFRVTPWANIIVDGKQIASGATLATTELTIGDHVVVFQNEKAKEREMTFTVLADGAPPVITARLEPRPALLQVRCDPPDAFVSVAGLGGKTAMETLERPLVVPLGQRSQADLEVIVAKQGYRPKRFAAVTFQAGETVTLPPVKLEPDE